jgi:hypothetical protein
MRLLRLRRRRATQNMLGREGVRDLRQVHQRAIQKAGRGKVKALSVRQPWAFWIAAGQKGIENRMWTVNYRGALLIHASKGMTSAEYENAIDSLAGWFEHEACERLVAMLPPREQLERGGIVAVVDLVKVVPSPSSVEYVLPWEAPGGYAWHFGHIRPVQFAPCNGAQGLWNPQQRLVEQIANSGGFDG